MNGKVWYIKKYFEFLAIYEWKTYIRNFSHKMNTKPLYPKRPTCGIPTFSLVNSDNLILRRLKGDLGTGVSLLLCIFESWGNFVHLHISSNTPNFVCLSVHLFCYYSATHYSFGNAWQEIYGASGWVQEMIRFYVDLDRIQIKDLH